MKKIILYGHYALDTIHDANGTHDVLGGPPAHMSPFLKAFGVDFAVVSAVGPDFAHDTHNPIHRSSNPTTRFAHTYGQGERLMYCTAVCDAILPKHVTEDAHVSVICSIANEIDLPTIEAIRDRSAYVIADMQGFNRVRASDGRVSFIDPIMKLGKAVSLFDYVKLSDAEAAHTRLDLLPPSVGALITAANGCTLLRAGASPVYAANTPIDVIDSTGAGDAFLAGFAYALSQGRTTAEAMACGNHCGTLSVQQLGVPNITPSQL